MDTKTSTFTFSFFTLLLFYTVSAARPTSDPPVTNPTTVTSNDASKISREPAGSKIFLPGEKVTSDETIANNLNPEPEKTTKNDTPRTNFTRFHPINRHFQVRPNRGPKQTGTHRRPCIKHSQYMIPPKEFFRGKSEVASVSRGKDVVASVSRWKDEDTSVSRKKDEVAAKRSDNTRSKTFRGEVPANWLKVKHHYGSRRQHNNQNYNHNNRHDKSEENVNVMKTKNLFDRNKMNNLNRQQKQKQNDNKSELMKNIRKFLKHTFD